ncbi:lipoprotein-releasing system permease protein [Allopseudospirillum japonicum]|uniref:Lipoprotein-releasing system permease protein n=1 Tax=Allopseudospirillum japonicum TaxID=64971 RepID=A0A1H6T6M0_9GAMM|nr:lipoprotein-releasing ABC transporter permease subunit [Allopseudospirillum japonicum]SEI75733.1 lipoprotein-releasing system permease protein [Allopseudospirillum japonicum]
MLGSKFTWFIGLRYTGAKRANHFISFISLTSMLGLTLGVAVLILVLSVMNGFDRELRQRILGMVPHTAIKSYSGIENWPPLIANVTTHPQVIAASPFIDTQGMLVHQGSSQGVLIRGIVPQYESQVSIIEQHMKEHQLADLKMGEYGIIMGEGLAQRLRLNIGDKVTLLLPEASITPAGIFPRLKAFKLIATFKVGADLDYSLAFTHLQDMQVLLRAGKQIQGIRLQLRDLFEAPQVSQQIINSLGQDYYALDWTRTHGNLFQAIQMEKRMIGLLLMVIVAVAAFNIVSTLVMVVTDKKADIAILRTLGATPWQIMQIFIIQGMSIGVIGTSLGVTLGVILALSISDLVAGIESWLGIQFLNSEVYFISYLPSHLLSEDVLIIAGSALIMSFLSTLYPAWKASRVQPAQALAYD